MNKTLKITLLAFLIGSVAPMSFAATENTAKAQVKAENTVSMADGKITLFIPSDFSVQTPTEISPKMTLTLHAKEKKEFISTRVIKLPAGAPDKATEKDLEEILNQALEGYKRQAFTITLHKKEILEKSNVKFMRYAITIKKANASSQMDAFVTVLNKNLATVQTTSATNSNITATNDALWNSMKVTE